MAKKKKNTALAAALKKANQKAAKTVKTTATKATVNTAAKKVTTAARNAAVSTTSQKANEAAKKAAKQAKKKAAAQNTQKNVLSNTKKNQQTQKKQQTQKRSGLILSDKASAQMQKFKNDPTYQKNNKKNSKNKKNNKQNSKNTKNTQKSSGSNVQRNALGTEAKTHRETYEGKLPGITADKIIGSSFIWAQQKKVEKEAKAAGYSDKEAKNVAKKILNQAVKDLNRDIEKAHSANITYTYKDLTMSDYNKMSVAAQTGTLNQLMKTDKDLSRKVADMNVKDYVKGAGIMGALDQMTQGLSVSENPVYKYSDGQKQIINRQKNTRAYNVGRAMGTVVEFGLGGTGAGGEALASSVFKTVGKAALRQVAKQGGKNLAKTTAKNVLKETAADAIVSLPLNTLDAVKFSYKDGKIDKKTLAGELAMNIAGDVLIGGTVSGITHGLTAKQVKNFNRIAKKLKKGEKVSKSEQKFFNKHVSEIGDEIEAITEKANSVNEQPKVTTVKNPYQGRTPVQTQKKTGTVEVKSDNVATAKRVIELTNGDKSAIKKAYQKIFDEAGGSKVSTVKDVTYKGEPYNVSVGKKVVGKVVSDKNLSAEKLAILDDLDNIIAEGKFVGSGEYIPHGTKKKLTERFDYFETDVNINGEPYVVSFDVEVFPNTNNYRTHQITKIDLKEAPNADVGPEPTARGTATSLSKTNIPESQSPVNVAQSINLETTQKSGNIGQLETEIKNIDTQISELKKNGSNDTKIADLEAQKATAEQNLDAARWDKAATDAYNYTTKTYDNAADMIKGENPSPEEFAKASKRIRKEEVPQVRQTAVKLANQAEDDVADIIEPWIKEGQFNKKVLQTQEEALEQAQKELADGRLYQNFMDSKVEDNEHLFMARAATLLEDLMKKSTESDEAAEQLLKVMDKATDASSHGGRLMNATKLLLRNTPAGRVRMVQKEVENLNKKFGDRLKGEKLELSPEHIRQIENATGETIADVADKITREIWEKIPATWFEKFNEIRHTSMLFNFKTHARNVLGNGVFAIGRLASDGLEVAAYNIPSVRKRLENLGDKVEMVHVTRKELSDNKEILNKIFKENYGKSGSKSRYVETTRPDGTSAIKNKHANKVIQANYKALEAEDMITFKPEYKKNFIRWCKANNVDLKNLDSLTKEQMQRADAYAMRRAELATFRDDSAFSRKIVGLKEKTANKKGKTALGTAGYRLGNVALESSLPFVKTPVNILKRSVDYSPIGLARSAAELMLAKDADTFMSGVHHMATGLTGTGVFGLGMWLANRDLITLKAGEASGDEYYDRDMGYQDYSLVVGGDNKFSVTIDWLSPMQTSLFMGATVWNNLSEKGFTLEDMVDSLYAVSGSMLDMSFMSTAKDTIETFMEQVYRKGTGEEADWSGAITKTLFGSVPQGYLNSFIPQVSSQAAQAFDSKQRDTRSTKEDVIAASWDSFGKKLANRIPVLRNKVLNPKIDRFGNDVETGNNVAIRLLNAFMNPSNVKRINTTDLDKEIISIYNSLEDGSDAKSHFFYNFTGNPSYDLGNGKRMSYDELYKYGKSKRIDQTKQIREMVNSKSYKNMTMEMKAQEVNGAHWISQTVADVKTYGNKFARNRIINDPNANDTDARAAKLSKKQGISAKEYMNFYLTKERLINRSHDSGYYTKALAAAASGSDAVSALYKINIDKIDAQKEYLKNGGSLKKYSNASCNVISAINKAEATVSTANKALAAAQFKIDENTYGALGIGEQKANAGVGLKKFGYDFDKMEAMSLALNYGGFDTDRSGSINKKELTAYIESLGLSSNEEKACIFAYFSTAKNPYGSVSNYLGFKNTESSSSGSGYSRSRSSSKKTTTTTEKTKKSTLPKWEDYVKDYVTSIETNTGVDFKSWDSPLDKTYQNKINSILKKTEV